jgi:elongation factor G
LGGRYSPTPDTSKKEGLRFVIMGRSLTRIRNIGIIAHIDAGKTTLTERILFYTGRSHRLGEVDDGTAIMDWMRQEQERGITITAAVTTCFWRDHDIHIVDTPGHVDFTIEVERSLRVLDGSVVIFSAVEGVEPQSETVWHQSEKYHIPKVVFINKLDRIGADFFGTVQMMREKLACHPLLLQIPWGVEGGFEGVIDLVGMKGIRWNEETLGATYEILPIPEDLLPLAEENREGLLESLADRNDRIAELYLAGEPVDEKLLKDEVRKAALALGTVPVLCGAVLKNKGVQPLLDAVIDYLPSPLDVPPVRGQVPGSSEWEERFSDDKAPLAALAFKVSMDQGRKLVYLRIYSGTIRAGEEVYNSTKGKREKIARLLQMHANKRERITSTGAGSLAAAMGLKETVTGDTLCDEEHPLLLEQIERYEPVISVAIEPKTRADQEKLGLALERLSEEDPTFYIKEDEETGQTIISGMGELHLEILVERMRLDFHAEVNVGRPQVVYRETILKEAEKEVRFEREIQGSIQSGNVVVRVEPLPRGEGNRVTMKITEEKIPQPFHEAIEQGIREAFYSGVILGYPVVDVHAYVVGGSYQEQSSSELAYKVAASMAFKGACKAAEAILLEPIMRVDVLVPGEFMGEVMGDLHARGGKVEGIEHRGVIQVITATIPLRQTFGYSTALRSLSQGRGTFSMHFSHYDRAERST